MAELALGAFGAGIAAIQTANGLIKLSDMLRDISQADRDIHRFHLETNAFIRVLETFQITVGNSLQHLKKQDLADRMARMSEIVNLFELDRQDIESVANKTAAQISDVGSVLPRLIIQLRWYFKKTTITALRLHLGRTQTLASLLISTINCQDLLRTIDKLSQARERVPESTKSLMLYYTDRVKRDKQAARNAARSMEDFHESHKSREDLLHVDTRVYKDVERAIQREASMVVPSRRRQRRTTSRGSQRETASPQSYSTRFADEVEMPAELQPWMSSPLKKSEIMRVDIRPIQRASKPVSSHSRQSSKRRPGVVPNPFEAEDIRDMPRKLFDEAETDQHPDRKAERTRRTRRISTPRGSAQDLPSQASVRDTNGTVQREENAGSKSEASPVRSQVGQPTENWHKPMSDTDSSSSDEASSEYVEEKEAPSRHKRAHWQACPPWIQEDLEQRWGPGSREGSS